MKYKTIIYTYETPQIGFLRYFLPVIQSTGFLKVKERDLIKKGAQALVGVKKLTGYAVVDWWVYEKEDTQEIEYDQ